MSRSLPFLKGIEIPAWFEKFTGVSKLLLISGNMKWDLEFLLFLRRRDKGNFDNGSDLGFVIEMEDANKDGMGKELPGPKIDVIFTNLRRFAAFRWEVHNRNWVNKHVCRRTGPFDR